MHPALQTAAVLAFAVVATTGTTARAQDNAFDKLAALHASAEIPTIGMASLNESWAGKCAEVDTPDQLQGGIEHFFLEVDPVIGNRVWAVETLYRDASWPTRATAPELQAERNRAQQASSNYDEVTASSGGLTTRYRVQTPNGIVEDVAYTLRSNAAGDGSMYWIFRVDCNLAQCDPLNGQGPVLRQGDAIAYCYFDQRVLPGPAVLPPALGR